MKCFWTVQRVCVSLIRAIFGLFIPRSCGAGSCCCFLLGASERVVSICACVRNKPSAIAATHFAGWRSGVEWIRKRPLSVPMCVWKWPDIVGGRYDELHPTNVQNMRLVGWQTSIVSSDWFKSHSITITVFVERKKKRKETGKTREN